ncbi:MAG: DUF885 domain-containing protein [Candidatus Zixiibacteriota bacterium]|nr:MAG: DUF885 domain-containing protein [candidate division Zixibacteria bacterium]
MKRCMLILVLCCLVSLPFFNCERKDMADQKFQQLVDGFLDGFYEAHPVWATYIGDHRYDHLIDDYSSEAVQAEILRLRLFAENIKSIDTLGLNPTNKVDFKILENEINAQLLRYEELRPFEKSPVMYTRLIGASINSLITREYAPLRNRLTAAIYRLKRLPALVRQAKSNLKNPPEVQTRTAIRQNRGNINLIKNDLAKVLERLPGWKDTLDHPMKTGIATLEDYQTFLEEDLLPRSNGEFRLGKKLFEKKLKLTLQSDLSSDEIVKRAEAELASVRKRMFELAQPLHEKMFPGRQLKETGRELETVVIKEVLGEIAKDHPKKDELLAVCRQDLRELQEFVRQKDLIDLAGINQLEVDWTPEFSRGVAVAGLDSPGPLDKDQKSFYRVSPVPDHWTEEQQESFLREYNNYMLIDLSIHEAMPGHYVQGYYDNQFPSLLRSIFGSGVFIEGWAVYAERMMVHAGYMDYDPRMELTQLKMYVRAVINAILDTKIHAGGMTEEEALELMIDEGFQERSEAEGKWVRASLTSTQLSTYFVGFQEIMDLERAYREKVGEDFSQKEFNHKLLSYGSPPVRFLREIILGSE